MKMHELLTGLYEYEYSIYFDVFPSKSLGANVYGCCCLAILYMKYGGLVEQHFYYLIVLVWRQCEHCEKCHRISHDAAKIHHILFLAVSICQWRSIYI